MYSEGLDVELHERVPGEDAMSCSISKDAVSGEMPQVHLGVEVSLTQADAGGHH